MNLSEWEWVSSLQRESVKTSRWSRPFGNGQAHKRDSVATTRDIRSECERRQSLFWKSAWPNRISYTSRRRMIYTEEHYLKQSASRGQVHRSIPPGKFLIVIAGPQREIPNALNSSISYTPRWRDHALVRRQYNIASQFQLNFPWRSNKSQPQQLLVCWPASEREKRSGVNLPAGRPADRPRPGLLKRLSGHPSRNQWGGKREKEFFFRMLPFHFIDLSRAADHYPDGLFYIRHAMSASLSSSFTHTHRREPRFSRFLLCAGRFGGEVWRRRLKIGSGCCQYIFIRGPWITILCMGCIGAVQ
jgi:hypothetical protein